MSNGYQQVDTGTKMTHLGKNTKSRIISKGIAAGHSQNTYRGLVTAHRKATGARNYTNCDSLLIGDKCGAHTVPYIEAKNSSVNFEHEATTSKISRRPAVLRQERGLGDEEAVALIVNGFVKDVIQQLPMEFAVEAQKLIGVSLEGSVGMSDAIVARMLRSASRSSDGGRTDTDDRACRGERADIVGELGSSARPCLSATPIIGAAWRCRSPMTSCSRGGDDFLVRSAGGTTCR